MPKFIAFSLSPFGASDIKDAANLTIVDGVAILTAEQTGNIGVGCCIDFDVGNTLVYIAPNRIAFNSGGTAELIPGDQIEGDTDGATGIIRFVEVTGGTWGGGDAAGYLYFESITGTFNASEELNRTEPTSSDNIATTNGSLQGNLGNGNTQFVVKDSDGTEATGVGAAKTVNSIHHEYASVVAFEAGYLDADHINNVDLTAADVVAHAACYYDHDDSTLHAACGAINNATTDATRYLQLYTPTSGAESINNQRHSGVWDAAKFALEHAGGGEIVWMTDPYLRIEGWQTDYATEAGIKSSFYHYGNGQHVKRCIIRNTGVGAAGFGIYSSSSTRTGLEHFNNIIYGFDSGAAGMGMRVTTAPGEALALNNTIYACYDGFFTAGADVLAKNNISYNNSNLDFIGAFVAGTDYNFSKDDTAPGTHPANSIWGDTDGLTPDFVNVGAGTEDFHIESTSDAIDAGTDLSSDGLWRDCDGVARDASYDIGADEYVGAPPSGLSIPIAMHHYKQLQGAC